MAIQGVVGPRDRIALVVTGNGLKDIPSARKAVGDPIEVEPELRDLEKVLGLNV